LYLTFPEGEIIDVNDKIELIYTCSNDNGTECVNPHVTKQGTFYIVTLSNMERNSIFQLTAVNITIPKTKNEPTTEPKPTDEPADETYIVSNPSPICVNCDFCLNENSANIFLTRVDFDNPEPGDKKKLFRQYISLPIYFNKDYNSTEFNLETKQNKIFGVNTAIGNATLDNCNIQTHGGGEDKFFDCNLASNEEFKDKGGKDDDHAKEFIIHFNVTDNFTIATKYELHLVKGEFLSLSFTLLFLFLGILF
jgi:hypothetical protein